MEYDEQQKAAIYHVAGPAIVLAGPGSGKTTVITERIRQLIVGSYVCPDNILVITFTKAAANEMKERFLKLAGDSGNAVTFGTFHAIFFTILKHAYNYRGSDIILQSEQLSFIRQYIMQSELEISDENEFAKDVMSEISRLKNSDMSDDIDEYNSLTCPAEVFRKIYKNYNEMLIRKRKIDFDDMILMCRELFMKRRDILESWQKRYKFILIDEFQDINQAQFDVMRMLADKSRNIFVVGDDDQSIYGFRGSNPDIMLSFSDIYPDAKRINLNINYRCSHTIVKASNNVISDNEKRYKKDTKADTRQDRHSGFWGMVKAYECEDYDSQNQKMIQDICELHNKGIAYADMAILVRTNALIPSVSRKLSEVGVPFKATEKVDNIFEHWIAVDMLTYMNIADGSNKRADYIRIINRPIRYITRECMPKENVNCDDMRNYYSDKEWMLKRIDELQFDLSMIKKMKPYAAINYIRKGVGYDDFINDYAREHRVNVENLSEVMNELLDSSRNSRNLKEWRTYIEKYTEDLKNKKSDDTTDAVIIRTMHSSKGLQYEAVFMPDVCEGITPYKKAVLDDEIEEERRMFYVAMTRAKNVLTMYYPVQRYNKKMVKSRFLKIECEQYPVIKDGKNYSSESSSP